MTKQLLAAIMCIGTVFLPRDAEAKSGRTYYTESAITRARQLAATEDWAKAKRDDAVKRAAWFLEISDEELWNYVPPAEQLRSLDVAFNRGCPVHGQEVYAKNGAYPWIMSREKPFKVQCPVGEEFYPSNDFVPWANGGQKLDTKVKYLDDGTGYIGEDGKPYYFVAHYLFWQRWDKDIIGGFTDDHPGSGLRSLRNAYLLTGDARYAHKAAILLARIARQYPQMNFPPQGVQLRHPAEVAGKTFDEIWENFVVNAFSTTYDAIYPEIEKDAALRDFLKGKGIDDPRPLVEKNILWEAMDAITGGRDGKHPIQIVGNFGMRQQTITELAVVLDNDDPARGMTKQEVIDWVMAGEGGVEDAMWNLVYRDGHAGESSPSYMTLWQKTLLETAKNLRTLGYDFFKHPKMWKLATVGLDLAILGNYTPSIGDSGGLTGNFRAAWVPEVLTATFQSSKDERVAKALQIIKSKGTLWQDYPLEEIQQAAARFDAAYEGGWPNHTRHMGGFGLVLAESQAKSQQEKVGLSLYYGYAGGGHGHRDRLTIEMFAFGRPLLTENGYPSPMGSITETPKRVYWGGNTLSHYGVVVNRRWQETLNRGYLTSLLGTTQLQFVEAEAAKAAYPDVTSLYRRTSLLIENPDGMPYLLDLFRVEGGKEHVWTFHGPPFPNYSTYGLKPVAQGKGTLAGTEVAFGQLPPGNAEIDSSQGVYVVKPFAYGPEAGEPASVVPSLAVPTDITSGFQYLFNVQRAPRPEQSWGAVWSDPEKQHNLRLTVPVGNMQEVVLADSEPNLYKYNPKTLPYLLAFNRSAGVWEPSIRSRFVAVAEPYQTAHDVTDVTRLTTMGEAHSIAVRVQRRSGQDFVVSNLDAQGRCESPIDGARLNPSAKPNPSDKLNPSAKLNLLGKLALVSLQGERLRSATVMDATSFHSPWLAVSFPGLMRGEIEAVDYERNTITLDRKLHAGASIKGQTIVIRNAQNNTSYDIREVSEERDKTVLHFGDVPMIVGTGAVSALDAAGKAVETNSTFLNWQVDGSQHAGRRLLGEDKKSSFSIRDFDRKRFQLEGEPAQISAAFSETSRGKTSRGETTPGKTPRFWIGDVGAGDSWEIPTFCQLTRDKKNPQSLQVKLNAALELSLPLGPGTRLVHKTAQGEQPLPTQKRDNREFVQLSPAMASSGVIELLEK